MKKYNLKVYLVYNKMENTEENEYSGSDNDSNEDTDQSDNESIEPKNIIIPKNSIIGTNVVNVGDDEVIDDVEDDVEDEENDDDVEDEDDNDNDDVSSNSDEDVDGKTKTNKDDSVQIMNIMSLTQGSGNTKYDSEDEDSDNELYLQKFNEDVNKNYIAENHPECMINNYDEISMLTTIIRDAHNNIIDPLHKTIPFLTKYEKARVLGQRAKQINSGAKTFVKIPDNVIDGYLVAEIELMNKRIPFIIRRPISGGGCEYWNLKDLEIIGF